MTVENERNSRILDVAERHFLAQGFSGARIDAIASEARVSKREIYIVWPSKDDLFLAAVRRLLPFAGREPGLPAATKDTRDALLSLARDYQGAYLNGRGPDLLRLRIIAARDFPTLIEEIHSAGGALWAKYGAFEELAQRGSLEAQDSHMAGIRFGGLIMEGARFVLGASLPPPHTRASFAEAAVDFYLYGYQQRLKSKAPTKTSSKFSELKSYPSPEIEGKTELRLPKERLDALFNAAMHAFATEGYYRAKLPEIASIAGVSGATIYRHFNGKEELFTYVIRRKLHELSLKPLDLPDANAELIPAFEALCGAVLDLHLDPQILALHRLLIEEAVRFPALAQGLFEIQCAKSGSAFTKIALRHGLMKPDEIAIRMFHALATIGPRYLLLQTPAAQGREALSRETAQIVLRGASREKVSDVRNKN